MAIPYTFTNGTLADATEVNANFAVCYPKIYDEKAVQSTVNSSGAVYINLGSVIYDVGSGVISSYLKINSAVVDFNAANHIYSTKISLSGAGISGLEPIIHNPGFSTGATTLTYPFEWIFTSGDITSIGGNVGSNYVIFIKGRSNANSSDQYMAYATLTGH